MSGPLEGIRILEWAVWLNGPAAGYMLGDLGAEVIKIEQPGRGDPTRSYIWSHGKSMVLPGGHTVDYEMPNRNKKSITLDLKQEKGRHALYQLVKKSDVFFTNFHRSTQARLGADYATLSRYNPKLIYAYNGGYGSLGPEAEKRTFDQLIQARTGFMTVVAGDSTEPMAVPGGIFDMTGATMLVYGILAALLARERQGVGQEIEVTLLNSALHLQAYAIEREMWLGRPVGRVPRIEDDHLYNYYRCADGQWLYIVEPNEDVYWSEFCQAVGMEELEEDPRFATPEARRQASKELIGLLEQVFATRNRDEWLKVFADRGCGFAYAPINRPMDLLHDPQVVANEYIVDFPHPTMGKIKMVGAPVKFSRTPCQLGPAAPELGEHTEEVLREVAGLTLKEINQLRAEGAI